MAPLFAFGDIDVCGLVCWLISVWPLVLLSCCFLLYAVRWWNALPTSRCPRCKTEPIELAVYNECGSCGCEYDKWGNILKDAEESPPLQMNGLDLARFTPQREGDLAKFKTARNEDREGYVPTQK
jgi:hypothetical protein